MLSKQAVQTREILSKQAVKIAKQAEEHERFINKAGFFLVLLYTSICLLFSVVRNNGFPGLDWSVPVSLFMFFYLFSLALYCRIWSFGQVGGSLGWYFEFLCFYMFQFLLVFLLVLSCLIIRVSEYEVFSSDSVSVLYPILLSWFCLFSVWSFESVKMNVLNQLICWLLFVI